MDDFLKRMEEENRRIIERNLVNLRIDPSGSIYEEKVIGLDNDGRVEYILSFEHMNDHDCSICSHSKYIGGSYECKILRNIRNRNLPENRHNTADYGSWTIRCDCYDKIEKFNIIHNKDEMLLFINRTFEMFDCIEDWEEYYGFYLNFDDDGIATETVDEYCDRGGTLEYCPNEYPSMIYFDYDYHRLRRCEWTYIGGKL